MARQNDNHRHHLRSLINTSLDNFRYRLAYSEALPQLAMLGIISGLLTSAVAIMFRLGVELPLAFWMPGGNGEAFETLGPGTRFALPFVGMLVIGLLYQFAGKDRRDIGVGHVIDRYQKHQAQLPAGNALLQFFAGILALISGHSVGREGPAIHLGAACSSLLGQRLGLPNNSLRILVGCGVAAAIAASFNTPLAGVIFAMEVVLMEYTITGFIPIILAAVTGAVMARMTFGGEPAFSIPAIEMASLWELPFLALCGCVLGLFAAGTLSLHNLTLRWSSKPIWPRLLLCGLLAGLGSYWLPEIMGIGYDTLEQAMMGKLSFWLLLAIVAGKILISTITIALGIPGGSIGPTLVTGACLGGCLGIIGIAVAPVEAATPGFYATVGMGAMMASVLNAPLAALIAILELTYNPNILLPSMLVIVIACITARLISRLPGLFLIGRDPGHYASPVYQMLSRVGVTSLMNRNFQRHSRLLPWQDAANLLDGKPDWVVVEDSGEPLHLLRPVDLANYLQENALTSWGEGDCIDLLEIPAQRWPITAIHARATLQEALMQIKQNDHYALYISQPSTPLMSGVNGIITRDDIDRYYQ